MTDVAAAPKAALATPTEEAAAPRSSWLDRLIAVIPIVTVFVWLCILYVWESRGQKTPWLFGDELQFRQLSDAIWHTGHAARRGEAHGFQTLYTYVTAPAWAFDDMHTAYATVKLVGVLTMTAVIFPTYLLARLLVSKPASLFAAVAAAAVPAFVYSPMLIPEPLAYPYAALCFFAITKALIVRTRWWAIAAVASCVLAPLVRGELGLIPFSLALALVFLWFTGERARRWRAHWTSGDWVGFVALCFGALITFNLFVGRNSTSFSIATGHYKHRMFVYGIWAAGALTIGLGILPVIGGLGALFRARGERRPPALRAFTAVAAAQIIGFGAYTAVKGSYLSTVFATRIEERNLIYVAPLLLVGTAIWLDRPRLRPVGLLVGGGFALYAILHTPYQLDTRLSIDTPGLSILSLGNRDLAFDNEATRRLLLSAFAIAVVLLLLQLAIRHRRASAGVGALAGALVVAWSLTGQIAASNASKSLSEAFLSGQPRPQDWVDRVTKGAATMYLGQNISDPNGIYGLEFWNRSIRYVWSLDGTAPKGTGPTETPNIDRIDGHLQQQRGELKYVVTEPGIDVVGDTVATATYLAAGQPTPWSLVRIKYPLRLQHAQGGVFSDGWMGSDASYTQYSTKTRKPGYAVVVISRRAWGGTDVPGSVTIRIGRLGINRRAQPYIKKQTALRSWTVHSHGCRQFTISSAAPPMRIEVHISPTFVPNELDPSIGDRRQLGAIVGMGFSDAKPSRNYCAG